ncbi:hypothetical protein C8R45DRAFT_1148207 [Mycena sanguinolenta]|nr:hypothetical protein C8R45DRAFT_1148207 [Mycena sanguinolenta]
MTAAQGRNFPVLIRSHLVVRRACVNPGNERGRARASRSPAASPAACRLPVARNVVAACANSVAMSLAASLLSRSRCAVVPISLRYYPVLYPPRAPPTALALAPVACLPSLFATATLLAACAPRPGIAHNQLTAVESRAARATATRDSRRAQRHSVVSPGGGGRRQDVSAAVSHRMWQT